MTRKERLAYETIKTLMKISYTQQININPYSNRLGMSRWDFINSDISTRCLPGINKCVMPIPYSDILSTLIVLNYEPLKEYDKFYIDDYNSKNKIPYTPSEFIEAILKYKFRNNIDSLLIYLNTLLVEVV
jgi:hypothetical protein